MNNTFLFINLEVKIYHTFNQKRPKGKEGRKSIKGTRRKKVFWKWLVCWGLIAKNNDDKEN